MARPARFDRTDICEAHAVLEWDYNSGGWLRERPKNRRLLRATSIQLARMKFEPSPFVRDGGYKGLSRNGKAIYRVLRARYGL